VILTAFLEVNIAAWLTLRCKYPRPPRFARLGSGAGRFAPRPVLKSNGNQDFVVIRVMKNTW
jgi:hypothetical protein